MRYATFFDIWGKTIVFQPSTAGKPLPAQFFLNNIEPLQHLLLVCLADGNFFSADE